MKTLYKFILKSYAGPFVMTFFIAMFVFFMMFIFIYIDDFVGKGLAYRVLIELFFYFSLTTIQMALPLAILLSSLMTFGNLGEHFELTAMKSAGLSLKKIMTPLIITISCISVAAFYFSNNVLPYTNLKAGALLYDVRSSKPALLFKDGIFNNSLSGFSIRIGKNETNGVLRDVMIYDHREHEGNNVVLHAEQGKMEETPNKAFLVLTLYNGVSYKEMIGKQDKRTYPFVRDKFKERIIRFDLSEYKMTRTNEELFKDNQKMLNVSQLSAVVDSLELKKERRKLNFPEQFKQNYFSKSTAFLKYMDTVSISDSNKVKVDTANFFTKLSKSQKLTVIETASNTARSAKSYIESVNTDFKNEKDSIIRYKIEWHRKFTLSIACLVLFFIGAPFGAIIRKGGLGMPVVVSVVFFIIFHVLSITGEKLAKEGSILPYQGMWMATVILTPIGILLTYKATSDTDLLDVKVYLQPLLKFFNKRKENRAE
ncbi:MAG: LptF/LptG family permease [Bacteroidia bacterium]